MKRIHPTSALYAIVDIETTGGYATNNAITEVAIVLHNGMREVKRYETLINPGMTIPRYVQALTGITDEMVSDAPYFHEIAPFLHEWLSNAVFVAHNVNFDYSFLKHQLKACGFDLQSKKLCTVRLSRKVFPGALSYSLGKICAHVGIGIANRHRAGGDVDATVLLFEKILQAGGQQHIDAMLKGKSREQYLPLHLPARQVDVLPELPGVYYFHDQKGKVIYVGKAKNLRKRVSSHFSNNKPGRQKQEFLRNIYSITHETTGTELMAFLLECIEIRRLWPAYNRSLKRFEPTYGLYVFEDRNGYSRLVLEKKKKQLQPIYTFSMLYEGQTLLWKLIREWNLCPKLCFVQTNDGPCEGIREQYCQGACEHHEPAAQYNRRVTAAVDSLVTSLPSFSLVDEGRHPDERSCILVEKGKFYGMGYLPASFAVTGTIAGAGSDIRAGAGFPIDSDSPTDSGIRPGSGVPTGADNQNRSGTGTDADTRAGAGLILTNAVELKAYLKAYPENDYIRGLVYQYVERWPAKRFDIRSFSG